MKRKKELPVNFFEVDAFNSKSMIFSISFIIYILAIMSSLTYLIVNHISGEIEIRNPLETYLYLGLTILIGIIALVFFTIDKDKGETNGFTIPMNYGKHILKLRELEKMYGREEKDRKFLLYLEEQIQTKYLDQLLNDTI